MYTLEGLMHGIERAKHNINVLTDAIKKEQETIKDYKIMMSQIEEADRKKEEAQQNVEIVHDGAH